MSARLEKPDKRYHDPDTFHQTNEHVLSGKFWVICPKDGIQRAERVIQWSQEASVIMQEAAGDEWFVRGRYTSGSCRACHLSLPVHTVRPTGTVNKV